MTGTKFDKSEDRIILERYRRMEWCTDKSENAVIPCPHCGHDRLHLGCASIDEDDIGAAVGVRVIMECDECHRHCHLGILEEALYSGASYMKLATG